MSISELGLFRLVRCILASQPRTNITSQKAKIKNQKKDKARQKGAKKGALFGISLSPGFCRITGQSNRPIPAAFRVSDGQER